MDPQRWRRAKELFDLALDRTGAKRDAFLSEACGADGELREEVESLLAASDAPDSLMDGVFAAADKPKTPLTVGTRFGPYEIVALIDAGGMGEVYKARDTRLNRTVALKTLPAHHRDDADRRRRFEREAQAVGALAHPHICVLYDVGHHNRIDFLVMEFLEGETLASRLLKGPLPIDHVLRYAVEIADALDKAHRQGIVHRDLKPGNLMLTKSGVKLLDFGLAKLRPPVAGAAASTAPDSLTEEGTVLGTLPYMAPEQLEGAPGDERSDIFAFGAVLYEMASGSRAFSSRSRAGLIAAILERDPEPLTAIQPAVPSSLDRLVRKCLAKDPAARWQSVSDVTDELRWVAGASGSDSGRDWRTARWAAAVALVAITVWVSGRDREDPADPLIGKTRIAVLPFENLTADRSDDWLAGAFSDSITAGLADVESLICISRDRIVELYRQRGILEAAPVDASTLMHVSDALGVRYYVHGSYQKLGDEIKVVARLVDGRDGSIRAQETVTDAVARLLAVEDDLANRFSQRLEAGRRAVAAPAAEASSLEAYRAVVEARVAYTSGATLPEALAMLQRAVELDPRYAQAWALLAKTKARMAAPASYTTGPLRELRYAALADARRAIALDPTLHEAYVALALAHRETEQALPWRAAAEQAIALNPRMAEAYALLADWYAATPSFGCSRDHDARRAETNFRTALRLDPLLAHAWGNLAHHLVWNGQVDRALQVTDEALRSLPGNLGIRRARTHALVLSGRLAEADDEVRALAAPIGPSIVYHRWLQATIALKRGAGETAGREFDAILASVPETGYAFRVALSYFLADQPDKALTLIDGAVERNRDCATFAATSPAFAPYRDTPAFRARLASWKRPAT